MRILFHVTLHTMLRHFESVVLSLAERGHSIRIAGPDRRRDLPPPAALAAHPRISFVVCPERRGDEWADPIYELRCLRDYMRYLGKPFKEAPKLRQRALRKMVKAVTGDTRTHLVARCPRCEKRLVDDQVAQMVRSFGPTGMANMDRLLALTEATVGSDRTIEGFLRSEQPDVLLVTPLINFGSYQADYVKSARALGVPVGFPVFSWDNLSNKGRIHVAPDRLFVWNEQQRAEAAAMHGIPADRVVVAGAPRFDEFFAMTPGTSRAEFCARHGVDPAQPIVTYLCSSEFVAGGEREFVRRWIDEVRCSPRLRSCTILVRPHPREQKQWKGFEIGDPRTVVAMPAAINADQTLFDTAFHSAVLVGLNTSAQLEAGIVGRPVLTILAPEFAEGQQGTIHFRYLLREEGGFVEVAPDFDVHRQQLEAALTGAHDPQRIRAFIERFLRPHGLARPVTPILVDAIEDLGAGRPVAGV